MVSRGYHIYEKLGIPKKDSMCIVESLFDIIKGELEKGNDVMILGFGKWSVKAKRERNAGILKQAKHYCSV
jgi:integration host factor subunit alpha